ncbi:MAG: hypothetical protein KatS3mg131_1317 [Candidatus Tectimicrobiota bacterium]|nr:MAG: hypothetical protein KatS3mg131_1317 [Candidatus Tectomicrobia bacterium]
MRIGRHCLGERVLLVAEIGNNHEGDFTLARRLVEAAAACGVDAVKFQTFRTEHFVSRTDAARFERLKAFELSPDDFARLAELAHALGLLFISTPLDLGSAEVLEPLVDAYKIASGDITFYPLIARVVRSGKPVILSTGASDWPQVARTVGFVRRLWRRYRLAPQLAVLHCVSSYPVPPAQANLRAIATLAARLRPPLVVGYSDHTLGLDAALLAVALGARLIEKHFTLDKQFSDFRDHHLAADPPEMRELVKRLRQAEALLGTGEKTVQPAEAAMVGAIRRSIVAAADLPPGHRLTWADLSWTRPAGGLPPGEERRLLGKVLRRPVRQGEPLRETDVGQVA